MIIVIRFCPANMAEILLQWPIEVLQPKTPCGPENNKLHYENERLLNGLEFDTQLRINLVIVAFKQVLIIIFFIIFKC